ncbi:MAG: phage integrase family protein [Thaumarchaeota archaeon]|nr:phage integrase family protein [Nitrososphaerota archaeon]
MKTVIVEVIDEFNPEKDYGITMRNGVVKCLSTLKKGQKISIPDFIREHRTEFTRKPESFTGVRKTVYESFAIGKKIGILKPFKIHPITFAEFCKLETIAYFSEQLRANKNQNLKSYGVMALSATQRSYLYELWRFNNWLYGKEFSYQKLIQVDLDSFKKTIQTVVLEGIEGFLELYRKSHQSESDFVRMIKRYLHDPMHKGKKAGTMKAPYNAILAYFDRNDTPLSFKFDPKAQYDNQKDVDEKSLSLVEVMKLLTVGKPTVMQKAVILCKFHRGLDTSTLCDRFNFEAWEQLVEYFGTDQYHRWDLSKCPVPIKLTRIKTNYRHLGFLDVDAITALQDWLDIRYRKTGKVLEKGEPIFINKDNKPITGFTVRTGFLRIVKTAGLDKLLEYERSVRYDIDSHELRDLLKSTLIQCGVRYDVSDHVIGHAPKDSYDKQAILYPETIREEYMKASGKINIFSNLSANLQASPNIQAMKAQIESMQEQLDRLQHKDKIREFVMPR